MVASQKRKAPEPVLTEHERDLKVFKDGDDRIKRLRDTLPDPSEDYQLFLFTSKKIWKITKEQRKLKKKLFGLNSTVDRGALTNWQRSEQFGLFTSTWQLLQLKETGTPGEVLAHALVNGKLVNKRIKVPRQVYLNLKRDELPNVSIDGVEVEKVINHSLPNGHPSVHLFKLTMSEDVYVSETKKLGALFNHPSVEGVYERQVPLNIRALLELGNKATGSQRGIVGKEPYDLNVLKKASGQESYLDTASLRYLYVFHVFNDDRQIFAIFLPSKNRAHVIIVSRTQDDRLPNLRSAYTKMYDERVESFADEPWQGVFNYSADMDVTQHTVTKVKNA
ncbi:hypothetical protein LTS18_001252, partial [Coniosporium uncinatum]